MELDRRIVVFPGREAYGRGFSDSFYRQYPEVRRTFAEAAEAVGEDIRSLCFSGQDVPGNLQTACLLTHCYSIYRIYRQRYGVPQAFAGYSQGEFAACAASGALRFADVLRLVVRLERLLCRDSRGDEGMYRIVDFDIMKLEKICEKLDYTRQEICISAYISRSQNIVSGKIRQMRRLVRAVKRQGARWAMDLHAARAYHCALCDDAKEAALPLFQELLPVSPEAPVFSCYDGRASAQPGRIVSCLSKQINSPIQWERLMHGIRSREIRSMVEIGPGSTVSGNARLTLPELDFRWIGEAKQL